ncbi:MAG: cytochrome c biogenesis protein CcsA, partial [Planctomycetota bacterium]
VIPSESGPSLSATAWMLEGLADRNAATLRQVIKLRNPEVAEALGLKARANMRYSSDEIGRGFQEHAAQLDQLFQRDRKSLAPAELQLVELAHNMNHVFSLIASGNLAVVPGSEQARKEWLPSARISAPDQLQMAVVSGWSSMLVAVRAGDAEAVERHAAAIMQSLAPVVDGERLYAENIYHRLALFNLSLYCDILCVLLLGVGLLGCRTWLWRLAVASLAIGIVCHLCGITLRVWIQCRPPVATLYESIVFVGLIAAILGLIVEGVRRRGDGAFVGATAAALLLLIAKGYTEDGDTMGMLVAVLNSNFWLTVHVLTITIGYGCALVTGVVAHVALSARIIYPADGILHRAHDRALLGLSLVSLLFTLFGTILGGIWADQSWGRFWGWDPKENGALLIVVWLIMMLHLRISGLAGPRGFAFGLILGNIVVSVAWFGVNLLGVGLHSYGFDGGTFFWLVTHAAIEIALAVGLWTAATVRQFRVAST